MTEQELKELIAEVKYSSMPEKSRKKVMNVLYSEMHRQDWILCEDMLPEEHESMFAKFKGTDKWNSSMFERSSDDVNVTVEFEDGQRKTMTLHTCDGNWMTDLRILKFKVVAWQPLPEPYKGEGGKEKPEDV